MRFQVGKGMDEYLSMLGNLEFKAPSSMGKAIYEGANIVADAIQKNIQGLRVDDSPHSEHISGIRSIQKEGLIHGFGIAKAETDGGYRNVKLGFDGYNKLKSKKYPNGQPNAMIARTFEAGNSFTRKQPFVGPAVRSSRAAAEEKMKQVIDTDLQSIFNK